MHLWAHHSTASSVDDEADPPRLCRREVRLSHRPGACVGAPACDAALVQGEWRRLVCLFAACQGQGPQEGARRGGGGAEAAGGGGCRARGQGEGGAPPPVLGDALLVVIAAAAAPARHRTRRGRRLSPGPVGLQPSPRRVATSRRQGELAAGDSRWQQARVWQAAPPRARPSRPGVARSQGWPRGSQATGPSVKGQGCA